MRYITILILAVFFTNCTKVTYIEGMQNQIQTDTTVTQTFSNAIDKGTVNFTNHWKPDISIQCEEFYLQSLNVYYFQMNDGTFLATDQYSNIQYITSPMLNDNTYISQWVLEYFIAPNIYRIKNSNLGSYLNIENGPLECGDVQPGWWSAQWVVQ
jgi:hypothetical protein